MERGLGEVSQETGDNFRYPSSKGTQGEQCPQPPPASLTRAVWNGPDEGGQHLHRRCGVGVLPQALLHFCLEPSHDVQKGLIGEAQVVQEPVHLEQSAE